VFLKVFDAPIEATVDDSGSRGVITYQNADGATLGGVELEARKNLAFLAAGLAPLTLVGNVTLARSRVTLEDSSSSIVTNPSRPLSQQSPWVINAAVDFEKPEWGTSARLSYNVAGPRIVQVGTRGLDDVHEQPRHTLDLAIAQRFLGDHLELKGTLQNIVDDDFTWTIGETNEEGAVVGRYALGQTFGTSATLSL